MNTKDKLEIINDKLEQLKTNKDFHEQINQLFKIIKIFDQRIDIASHRINTTSERIDSLVKRIIKLEQNDNKNTELVEEFVNHNFKQNA